jgi:hypothetical protein
MSREICSSCEELVLPHVSLCAAALAPFLGSTETRAALQVLLQVCDRNTETLSHFQTTKSDSGRARSLHECALFQV